MTPQKRKNGFDYPRSINQLVVAFFYLVSFGLQFVFISLCIADRIFNLVCLIIHALLGITVFTLWYICSAIDPECLVTDKPIPECTNLFGAKVERRNLFCSTCRKRIYGMDHHCIFLNNCVGSRNYVQFISLLITAFAHMLFDSGLTVYFEILSRKNDFSIRKEHFMDTFRALMGIQISICLIFCLIIGALIGLHIFLNFVAFRGTFDWVLYRRELRGIVYKPYQMDDDQPNILEEISNSFSSHMFHDRSRNYTAPAPHPISRYNNNLQHIEEVDGVRRSSGETRKSTSDITLESQTSNSRKNRLLRSELLRQKASSTIYPESHVTESDIENPPEAKNHLEIQSADTNPSLG